jgi:hypothetical protein
VFLCNLSVYLLFNIDCPVIIISNFNKIYKNVIKNYVRGTQKILLTLYNEALIGVISETVMLWFILQN